MGRLPNWYSRNLEDVYSKYSPVRVTPMYFLLLSCSGFSPPSHLSQCETVTCILSVHCVSDVVIYTTRLLNHDKLSPGVLGHAVKSIIDKRTSDSQCNANNLLSLDPHGYGVWEFCERYGVRSIPREEFNIV